MEVMVMKFTQIDNVNLKDIMTLPNVYLMRVSERSGQPYISSKLVLSLTVKEVMEAIVDPNIVFVRLEEA
jgi:hypothetical protein